MLKEGNLRRKTESTDANAQSSRSHAILEIYVSRTERNKARYQILMGKLSLVDLAGSERAHDTNNTGQKLRDGANINKSLLALANCINALGKNSKGVAYVPYRNSKLTRLLKGSLAGNGRTAMIATVSCGSDQYGHTTNTLKYADRAKEIKTHFSANANMVTSHAIDYQRLIDALQGEVDVLRRELDDKDQQITQMAQGPPGRGGDKPHAALSAPRPPPASLAFPLITASPGQSPATGSRGHMQTLSPGALALLADPDADLAWVDALTSAMQHNSEARAPAEGALRRRRPALRPLRCAALRRAALLASFQISSSRLRNFPHSPSLLPSLLTLSPRRSAPTCSAPSSRWRTRACRTSLRSSPSTCSSKARRQARSRRAARREAPAEQALADVECLSLPQRGSVGASPRASFLSGCRLG